MNKQAEASCIKFDKLGTMLENRGLKWDYLIKEVGISPAIVTKIKKGTGHTDTRTIQKICLALRVQPGQIMEIVMPDSEEDNETWQVVETTVQVINYN